MRNPTTPWPRKTRELQTAMLDSTRWNGFKFRDGDIIVSTWSKSGTTWMLQILSQLIHDAPEGVAGIVAPWLDLRIIPIDQLLMGLEAQSDRRLMKTHLPVDALTFSPKVKYIYVGRDPRDIVWSAYNHQASFTPAALEYFNNLPGRVGPPVTHPPCDVRDSYRHFLKHGEMEGFPTAEFWSHTRGWWDVAELPNVLPMHFNNLKTDLKGAIRRLARFLDVEVDEDKYTRILDHTSFEYMQREAAKLDFLSLIFTAGGKSLIHQGTNERWRDCLSAEEINQCDEVAVRALGAECAHWLRTGELST